MINKSMYADKFDDSCTVEVTFKVRESGDTGWFDPEDLLDDNQLTKPTSPADVNRVTEQDGDSYIDKDGKVFMYEFPAVTIKANIILDVSLDKIVDQSVKSQIITAQKGYRLKGTKWLLENVGKVQTLLSSELSKGRTTLTVADKAAKAMGKDASEDDFDAAIKRLQELKKANSK